MRRVVLSKYSRFYLDILLAMAATMAILCYSLFAVTSGRNSTLIVTVVPVTYCVMRYMLQIVILDKGESPENILLSDEMFWLGIAVWLFLCVAILYGDIHLFAEMVPNRFQKGPGLNGT